MWSLVQGYCHYHSPVSDSAWIRGLDIKICSCRQCLWKSLILIFWSDALILRSISLLGSRIIFGWGLKKMVGNLGVIGPRLRPHEQKSYFRIKKKIVIQNQERKSEFIQAFIRLDFDYFNCFKDFPKDQKNRRLLFRIPDLSKRLTSRNINRREKRYFRCGNSVKDYLSAGHFCVFFSGAQAWTKFSPLKLFSFSKQPRFRLIIIMLSHSRRYIFRIAGAKRTYNPSKRWRKSFEVQTNFIKQIKSIVLAIPCFKLGQTRTKSVRLFEITRASVLFSRKF